MLLVNVFGKGKWSGGRRYMNPRAVAASLGGWSRVWKEKVWRIRGSGTLGKRYMWMDLGG